MGTTAQDCKGFAWLPVEVRLKACMSSMEFVLSGAVKVGLYMSAEHSRLCTECLYIWSWHLKLLSPRSLLHALLGDHVIRSTWGGLSFHFSFVVLRSTIQVAGFWPAFEEVMWPSTVMSLPSNDAPPALFRGHTRLGL